MTHDPTTVRDGAVAAAIRERRLIAVLRGVQPRDRLLGLVDELVRDGITVIEVTFDAPGAPEDVVALREAHPGDAIVGAGTIRTSEQLAAAVVAGAAFGVSPVFDPAIVAASLEVGLPFTPGAATPSEADAAWRAGATFVKLFPGSSLGPSFVRELRGPLPEIRTVVTGGVDSGNAVTFLQAGATAVGIGSALGRMSRDERRRLVAEIAAAGDAR